MIASRPVYPVLALRVVLAAALLCLLASCPQSIPELRGAVSIRLVSAEGRVVSQSASRTILPDFASLVGSIEINRYAPNATTAVATQSFEGLSPITLADIDPGSWEFEAKLYFTGASEPFATGRSAATTIQEGASPAVNIPLTYNYGTGTGGCTITVSWPADDADALSWGLDAMDDNGTIDQNKMNTVSYTDSSPRSATITITNAQVGARRLVLAFSNAGENAGVFTESVNIFQGVSANEYIQAGGTAATISFGPGRLLNSNASLGGLGLTNGNNTISLSPGFSLNIYEYTAPVANLSSFSFTPIRSIAGQKIMYQWNNEMPSDPIRSGVAQACNIEPNATNTLVITVTAPNGETTQTYTVRFVNSADIGWSLNPEYVHLGISAPDGLTTIRLPHEGGPASITLGATTGFTEYAWATNPVWVTSMSTDHTNTFTPSNAGTYSVWCTAKKDGLLYSSNTIVITVLPAATLVYNGNGHTGGSVPSWNGDITAKVAAQGDMVKSGYRFVRWNTDRTGNASGTQFAVNDPLPTAVTDNTADVVLYANWQNVAPPPVTNVVITPLSDSLKVTWQDPDVADLKEIQVEFWTASYQDENSLVTVHPGVQTAIVPGYDASEATKVKITVSDQGDMPTESIIELPANFGNMSTFHIDSTTTAATLKSLLDINPNGLFILEDNITLNDWTAAGSEAAPFNGIFNGNGKTITIFDSSSTGEFGGFLACVGVDGEVRNLAVNITATSSTGDRYGGITGYNYGLIEYCMTTGSMSNKNGFTGGLVGTNGSTGIIRQCYSTVDISAGSSCVGGIAGNNWGLIENSYAHGSIGSTNNIAQCIGGFVGLNQEDGSTVNCYSTGSVPNRDYSGGLVGMNHEEVINSFYDKQTSTKNDTVKGIPKTTVEMQTQSTFTDPGWDFDSVWAIDTNINNGYPYLRYFGAATATP